MVQIFCTECGAIVPATLAAGSPYIQVEHCTTTFGTAHILRGPA